MQPAIATVRRILARLGALPFAVGANLVIGAQVALLGAADVTVTTVARVAASWRTATITAVIDPVVTELTGIDNTIATLVLAVTIAGAQYGTVVAAIVTDFARLNLAVTTRS